MSKSNFTSKVYQAVGQVHLSIPHKKEVDGELKYLGQISFEGGQINPKRIMSTYKATDPEIAEYLDNHASNEANEGRNTLFKCIEGEGEEETEESKSEKTGSSETESKDTEPELVEGPDTVQDASDYLYETFDDVKRSDVKTADGVNTVAKEKGIVFPNLD